MKYIFYLLALITTIANSQSDGILARHPTINHDGSKIAFSFQGDIWTVSTSGGRAERLTIHAAYESYPEFSSDGQNIGFSGERFGNNDIFVIPTSGGVAKRVT
ncbi:MAG: hypothetical protein RIA63_10750, partial [Cyclobacteriaceae bacterium]